MCGFAIKQLIFVAGMLSVIIGEAFGAGMVKTEHDYYGEAERIAGTAVYIGYASVGVPLGRILLIRKDKDICAISFTEFHRGHDTKPPTIFNSGEETLYAEYDWFYQGDGSDDFSNKYVKSGHEKITRKPLTGIGRLSFQTGTTFIKCGPFRLQWSYPNGVAFYSKPTPRAEGIELAPTKWRNITEVNVRNPHVKWYLYDNEEKRETKYIPVEDLW